MKVTVRNPEFERKNIWMFEQPEFFEYEGEEVKPGKWENPESVLCMTTGIKDWPVRSIQRKNIVSIDGTPFVRVQSNAVKVFKVKGSKGSEYVVTGSNGNWTCTCPGFQFRKSCKHTAEAV